VVAAACASAAPRQTRLMAEQTKITASTDELRVMVRDLARPFAGILEETADRLAASSGDPRARLDAARFKTSAIPAMQEALYRRDPLEAALDAGLLLEQMRIYFDESRASEFGPQGRVEVDRALTTMREDLERVIVAAGGDPEKAHATWALLERWAREDPISETFASRRSSQARLAQFTARTGTQSALRTVASLQDDIQDLTGRLDLYFASLPKLARWQAEQLLLEGIQQDGPLARSMAGMPAVPLDLREIPFDVPAERRAMLEGIHAEREGLQAWADGQSVALQRLVTGERQAVLTAVTAEREAVLADVAKEREIILAEAFERVRAEREAALVDLGRELTRAIAGARTEIVDHAIDRLTVLVAVSLVAIFLGALALMLIWRRLTRS